MCNCGSNLSCCCCCCMQHHRQPEASVHKWRAWDWIAEPGAGQGVRVGAGAGEPGQHWKFVRLVVAVAVALVYAFIKHQTKSKTSRIYASYIVSSRISINSRRIRILHVFCIQMQSRQLAIYAHNLSHRSGQDKARQDKTRQGSEGNGRWL